MATKGSLLNVFMLTADYIVGLVDGEGSFTVYVRNQSVSSEKKRRTRVEPRFYLKLIEKDKFVLYSLKDYFGCGNVYFQRDNRKNHQNCYRFEVTSREDLSKIIIPFFKKNHLKLVSKRKDFEIFCLIMEMIGQGRHLAQTGLDDIFLLNQKMH